MIELVVVGSVALDSVETPFGKTEEALGGSATFASIAASYFCSPGIVAVVGKDFPEKHVKLLSSKGVDVSGMEKVEGKTFRWKGKYGFDLNVAKTLSTELNVFASFSPKIPDEFRKAEYVFLGNIDPELQLKVLDQIESPKLVVSDTMNYWIENKREKVLEAVEKVDLALMNDGEARELFGTTNLLKAAREILRLNSDYAIIKKGEHGSIMVSKEGYFSMPGFPLENVADPTGAGDSFAGALIGFLVQHGKLDDKSLRKAIVYGSTVASFNAESFSLGKLSGLTKNEIEERFSHFRELVRF